MMESATRARWRVKSVLDLSEADSMAWMEHAISRSVVGSEECQASQHARPVNELRLTIVKVVSKIVEGD